jgi:hypothetical protein
MNIAHIINDLDVLVPEGLPVIAHTVCGASPLDALSPSTHKYNMKVTTKFARHYSQMDAQTDEEESLDAKKPKKKRKQKQKQPASASRLEPRTVECQQCKRKWTCV